jgi:hypothetical protein
VMDVRADTYAGGTGTHYSGKPVIGGIDSSQNMYLMWEDSRSGGASSGDCGYSNAENLVRACGQKYSILEQNYKMDGDWAVKIYVDNGADSPQLTVNTALAEWDGVQMAKESSSQTWTWSADSQLDSILFESEGTYPPPTDTVGNVTMRRLMVKLTHSQGSVDILYDNTGFDSRLEAGGTAGTQDNIDDVPSADTADGLSTVGDGLGNVHMLLVDDEDTDQISYLRRTGSSWGTAQLAAGEADSNDAYPSISRDTATGDIYAIWIDTSANIVYSNQCDISEYSDCSSWVGQESERTSDTFTHATSNYAGPAIMAMWSVGDQAPYHVDWELILIPEKLWLFMGMAPLIPLLLKRKRKQAYALVQKE